MAHGLWPMVEARAHFSGLLDRVQREGYQWISRNGATVAVVVPASDWTGGSGAGLRAWRQRSEALALDDAQIEAGFLPPGHRGEAERRAMVRLSAPDPQLAVYDEEGEDEVSSGY